MEHNYNLKHHNTFGISISADTVIMIDHAAELDEIYRMQFDKNSLLILGQGSNILFTKTYSGVVLLNHIKGKEIIREDGDHVYLKVYSGEIWSDLVDYTVLKGWGGLENLSLIPGTVGAAPVQNIGAYGVEIKESLLRVEAFDLLEGKLVTFPNEACGFGYRDSIFKSSVKGRYFILAIQLKLSKNPLLNLSYAPLQKKFEGRLAQDIKLAEFSEAVKEIRRSKLPDPSLLGNAGSFFKNPVVKFDKIKEIAKTFPEVPFYKLDEENYKLAAGWLIEKSGWKGKRIKDAGVHKNQALVLVNYGHASGVEIYKLSEKVKSAVYMQFGVSLEREVTVI